MSPDFSHTPWIVRRDYAPLIHVWLLDWVRWTRLQLFFSFIFISWRLITSQHFSGFCHTLTWISHGVTCIPHPNPLSTWFFWVFPVHQGWALISYIQPGLVICFTLDNIHAVLLKHPTLTFSQSPKVCSVHLCLFFCFAYRVIITIFLNSIYMH